MPHTLTDYEVNLLINVTYMLYHHLFNSSRRPSPSHRKRTVISQPAAKFDSLSNALQEQVPELIDNRLVIGVNDSG